jgi:hypothetical protein
MRLLNPRAASCCCSPPKRSRGRKSKLWIDDHEAKIDAILDAAETASALDQVALAELPSRLAEQLRASSAAVHAGSGTEIPAVDELQDSPIIHLLGLSFLLESV